MEDRKAYPHIETRVPYHLGIFLVETLPVARQTDRGRDASCSPLWLTCLVRSWRSRLRDQLIFLTSPVTLTKVLSEEEMVSSEDCTPDSFFAACLKIGKSSGLSTFEEAMLDSWSFLRDDHNQVTK